MGRYDEPHFETTADVVSVWVATDDVDVLPDNYFMPDYGGDEDSPFNLFATAFGFGYYDMDNAEANYDNGRLRPLADLLEPISYAASFKDAVQQAATALGIHMTSCVCVLFNFRYDPTVTKISKSEHFQFVGVFPYQGD